LGEADSHLYALALAVLKKINPPDYPFISWNNPVDLFYLLQYFNARIRAAVLQIIKEIVSACVVG
jgi:hypothetical protein